MSAGHTGRKPRKDDRPECKYPNCERKVHKNSQTGLCIEHKGYAVMTVTLPRAPWEVEA